MSDFQIRKIGSLDIPQLQPYRSLRRPQEHLNKGIFIAEGEKVVRRFLASDWTVLSLLMTQEWFEEVVRPLPPQRLANTEIFIAEKCLLDTIVGLTLHQAIMGVGQVPFERSLLDTVSCLPSPHFLVALDGLALAENVGAIVRNCAGFGVDGIIAGKTSASPYLRRAVRNSMGGIFKVPAVHVADLAVALEWLKSECGTRIIIADAHASTQIDASDFSGNICIVLGNENAGTSETVAKIATDLIRIPMRNATDSLNVASASAVMLYEAERRRN